MSDVCIWPHLRVFRASRIPHGRFQFQRADGGGGLGTLVFAGRAVPDGRWSLALDVCSAVCARVGERREKGCVALVVTRSLQSRLGMLRTDSSFARAHRRSLTSSESGHHGGRDSRTHQLGLSSIQPVLHRGFQHEGGGSERVGCRGWLECDCNG